MKCAAMQAAVDTYQQALQAAPSTELFDRYIGFLTEQLQQHLQPAGADDTDDATAAQQPASEPAAAAAAARVLAAIEQAADAGDRRRLRSISRCPDPAASSVVACTATSNVASMGGNGLQAHFHRGIALTHSPRIMLSSYHQVWRQKRLCWIGLRWRCGVVAQTRQWPLRSGLLLRCHRSLRSSSNCWCCRRSGAPCRCHPRLKNCLGCTVSMSVERHALDNTAASDC